MTAVDHLLAAPVTSAEGLTLQPLTRALARRHGAAILELLAPIPADVWSLDDLLGEGSETEEVATRWSLSLLAMDGDRPVGVAIIYLRSPSERHPLKSAYLHRLAVSEHDRRRGIGSLLVNLACDLLFSALPWLLTVSVQATLNEKQPWLVDFYEALQFRRAYWIPYQDKNDVLLERQRNIAVGSYGSPLEVSDEAALRIGVQFAGGLVDSPVAYFRTGSAQKRQQYSMLLRSYGVTIRQARSRIDLTEPQVEGSGAGTEENLVRGPLKLVARFNEKDRTYPFVVEDTMLFIEHFNSRYDEQPLLPGPDTKRWWQALGDQGIVEAMDGSHRRRARYVCQLGVSLGPGQYRVFRSALEGSIGESVANVSPWASWFPYSNDTFFHTIFVPEGGITPLALLDPLSFAVVDYRRRCAQQLCAFLCEVGAAPAQGTLFEAG